MNRNKMTATNDYSDTFLGNKCPFCGGQLGSPSLEPDPEIGEYLVTCSRCGEGFIDVELTEINFPDGRVIFVDERTKKAYLNQNIPKLCGDCGLQEFYDIEQNLLYCPNFTGDQK